jgi:hypothetical protein
MVEREILVVDDKVKLVKALGIEVNCKPEDLHVLINGVDIMEVSVIETIRITYTEKKEE